MTAAAPDPAPASAPDSAPWLIRKWWIPAGIVLGFIIGGWQYGLFDPAGHQIGDAQ